LDYGRAIIWPRNTEIEYLLPVKTATLIVGVDEVLAAAWSLAHRPCHLLPPERLKKLESVCRLATLAVSRSSRELPFWRAEILMALELALTPWFDRTTSEITHPGAKHYKLVREAEALLEQDLSLPLTMADVAAALGVSRRTLFQAFKQSLGLGPHTYFQIIRMHRFRERLIADDSGNASITRLAAEMGFTQLGRLAAMYRDQFNELPSQTLKRTSSSEYG
jgi:AraC-like DNA-binding protein